MKKNRLIRLLWKFCLVLYLLPLPVFSQTNSIDSLKQLLSGESVRENQLSLTLEICAQHASMPKDSLLHYILIGLQRVDKGSPEDYLLKNYYVIYLSKADQQETAMALCDSLLAAIPDSKIFTSIYLKIFNTKGIILVRSNQNRAAIENGFSLLKKAEDLQDTLWTLRAYILLGWANMELEKYQEGITWFRKGLDYTQNDSILAQNAYLFANIASCYNNVGQMDSAFHFIDLALKYGRRMEVLTLVANALNIRADMYLKQNNIVKAEQDMQEAIKIRQQSGDMLFVISDMAQLSSFYASVHQTEKGIQIAQDGIQLARGMNNLSKLIFLYSALAENYQVAGKKDLYGSTLVKIIGLKDSLYQNNSVKAIADLEAKYELQRKENIIIQQNNKITQNRYFTLGTVVLVVFLSMFIGLLYRNRQLVQLRKMETRLIEQKIMSIEAVKEARENERKRIAADLHDSLGSYAASITSNIKYLREGASEYDAIITRLDENAQSMVTQLGDTIWVLKNEQLPFTKLADRFKVWMQRLIQNYPEIRYYYSENIENDMEFTPVKILQIFLILKECVTNVIKHSAATELKINFSSEPYWSISIADNGIGINECDLENNSRGNGISNIKRRAEENNWSVSWQKTDPQGTLVIISERTTK